MAMVRFVRRWMEVPSSWEGECVLNVIYVQELYATLVILLLGLSSLRIISFSDAIGLPFPIFAITIYIYI